MGSKGQNSLSQIMVDMYRRVTWLFAKNESKGRSLHTGPNLEPPSKPCMTLMAEAKAFFGSATITCQRPSCGTCPHFDDLMRQLTEVQKLEAARV